MRSQYSCYCGVEADVLLLPLARELVHTLTSKVVDFGHSKLCTLELVERKVLKVSRTSEKNDVIARGRQIWKFSHNSQSTDCDMSRKSGNTRSRMVADYDMLEKRPE